MKKLLLVLMFSFPMMSFAKATDSAQNASRFQEGTHYEVLGLAPTPQPTVTKLFSIYCGGCYQWEKGPLIPLKSWLAQQNIEFRQVHMDFMGAYGKQASMALAMTLGTPHHDSVKQALFNRLHVERKGDWRNDKDFFLTLEAAGLKQSDFEANQNNLMVMRKVLDWKQFGDYVHAVPSFMVNNRYLINMGSLKSYDDLNALITYLTKLPAEDTK
ncbi:thioredoxin domain-containing protein [Endozoicomonas sp. SESOKO1]|uniref:thioredoxin domain-containing protein n=1 Tax=Endozoicomonas sp. SESOKO1 TaxID=2828742 RepID=UPI0021495D3D|nr:thioredoxin domain-containing protein [Endozoicomonas sp. SESOKO1]